MRGLALCAGLAAGMVSGGCGGGPALDRTSKNRTSLCHVPSQTTSRTEGLPSDPHSRFVQSIWGLRGPGVHVPISFEGEEPPVSVVCEDNPSDFGPLRAATAKQLARYVCKTAPKVSCTVTDTREGTSALCGDCLVKIGKISADSNLGDGSKEDPEIICMRMAEASE